MRYKHLSRNRWLDLKPEKLYSDGVNEYGDVIIDADDYPGRYIDASPDPDMGRYKRALDKGFYRIVISDKNPGLR